MINASGHEHDDDQEKILDEGSPEKIPTHNDEGLAASAEAPDEAEAEQEASSDEECDEISFRVETNTASGAPVFSAEDGEEEIAATEEETDDELSPLEAAASEDSDSEAADTDELAEFSGDEQTADIENQTAAEPQEGLALSEELSLSGKVEAIIFASPKPLRTVEIHELLMDQGYTLKEIQDALDELSELYRDRGGGFHLKYIKRMGYQFQTTPAAKGLMEKQFSSRPRPLSRAALETLAVIAYRQKHNKGVTRAEVEFIRGVDAGSIFKTLVERNLLTCIGRKEIPGRPMMFGVTDEFLKVFQLGSINDLPPLESFQSPPDVIKAANEKIAQFEAEQEGVDPEAFIGDESYTETLGEGDFDILAAQAAPYAPSLERLDEVRADVASAESEMRELDAIPPEVLASMAQSEFAALTEAELAAAVIEAKANAIPAEIIEHMAEAEEHTEHAFDELDKMDAREIAFSIPAKSERAVEGASLAPADDDWDADAVDHPVTEAQPLHKEEEEIFESLPVETSDEKPHEH